MILLSNYLENHKNKDTTYQNVLYVPKAKIKYSGHSLKIFILGARFGSTYTKIGTIQRRLAWPLRKDDTQIHEAFHIF